MPEKVQTKLTGTLTSSETPTNQISHEITSIPTSSINENSRFGGKSRGMKV